MCKGCLSPIEPPDAARNHLREEAAAAAISDALIAEIEANIARLNFLAAQIEWQIAQLEVLNAREEILKAKTELINLRIRVLKSNESICRSYLRVLFGVVLVVQILVQNLIYFCYHRFVFMATFYIVKFSDLPIQSLTFTIHLSNML